MKGSIQKRTGKRGTSWTVVYDEPTADGRRKQRRKTFRTKREAERFIATTVHQLQAGTYVEPNNLTLGAYLLQWSEATAARVKPATLGRYRQIIRDHLIPDLGHIPIGKLTSLTVQEWIGRKQEAGYKPNTIKVMYVVLHRALAQAVKWQLISRNVSDEVDKPRILATEVQTWTLEEARRFLAAMVDDDLYPLWVTAISTGMRLSELLALRWSDVSLDGGRLSVRRTLSRRVDSGWSFGPPKSRAGQRQIALPKSNVVALRAHRTRQLERRLTTGMAWQDEDLVFDRGDGAFHKPETVTSRFKRVASKNGMRRIRFHDLRHTAATLMLAEGVHPKIVQERLGHSTIAMTLNLYSHVSMDMQRDAADRLDALLSG